MTKRGALLVAAWTLLAATPKSQVVPPSGTVTGVVIDDRGAPVPLARVGLVQDERFSHVGQADDGGRFTFETIAPGAYVVLADKAGFVGLVWHELPADARVVVEAQRVTEAAPVRLERGGTIVGRVVLADGAPAVGGEVHVSRLGDYGGSNWRWFTPSTRVGSQGGFRLYGLPAGEYQLRYGPELLNASPVAELRGGEHATVEVGMYFPGTYYEQEAAPISVRAGETVMLGSLSLVPASLARLRGTIEVVDGLALSAARVVCGAGERSNMRRLAYDSERVVNVKALTFDCGFMQDGVHEVQILATAPPERAGGASIELEGRAVVTVNGSATTAAVRLHRNRQPQGR